MPKKKTIPPPDDFSSEFMETESAKELPEQQVEAAGSDNTETPLAGPPEVDLGSGDVSGTADVEENELDAENTADAAETVPVSDEKAEDPEYDSILQELNSSTPAPLDSSGENALDALLLEGNAENAPPAEDETESADGETAPQPTAPPAPAGRRDSYILTVDAKDRIETEEERREVIWHEIKTSHTVPAEEDGEEDTAETWYIYTIRYNGEAYFADTIFALTDEQKDLAENYAENLSLFLGDGLFQYAPSTNTITALGDVRFTDGETEVIYFNQLDERYANQPYGTDHIGGYGCGPTSMAIVVSSLTSETVDPAQMARWAYEHGYWCSKSGSYHTLIPSAAQAWGLSVEGCTASEPQRILDALADGKLVVALMTKGHFTKSGHFIVLRGVQDEKILVADPASYRRSQKTWDLSIILNEASRRAGAGGPFWIIG